MAGLEVRNGRYNLILRFGGKRFVRSLKTDDEDTAYRKKARVEENIALVESGRLHIPDGADVVTFLLSDGQLTKKPVANGRLTLSQLFSEFLASMPEGNLEGSTLSLTKIHQHHLERHLGKRFSVRDLTQDDLQQYIVKRSKEKGRKGKVTATTIKKELGTFRSVWNWGTETNRLSGRFPNRNLRYPKSDEPPPFQTWTEIERQIAAGASEDLWDALYLDMEQIERLLEYVKQNTRLPFLYPMFAFAAYTGARRSEIIRAQAADFDFHAGMIQLRENKRVPGQASFRRLPMADPLKPILNNLSKGYAFTHNDRPLTKDQAAHYFIYALKDSEWKVVKGWHTLRHSFASNCACKGIDQRIISEWLGHQTVEMERRYRHLFPHTQQEAMSLLFR